MAKIEIASLFQMELPQGLSILEYIRETSNPIDCHMLDRFWSLDNNDLIYVDNDLIKWMGYRPKRAANSKHKYIENLKSHPESTNGTTSYLRLTNNQYDEFLKTTIGNFPPCDKSCGKNQTLHLIVRVESLN